jgi:hypothetical protein
MPVIPVPKHCEENQAEQHDVTGDAHARHPTRLFTLLNLDFLTG